MKSKESTKVTSRSALSSLKLYCHDLDNDDPYTAVVDMSVPPSICRGAGSTCPPLMNDSGCNPIPMIIYIQY